MYLRKKGKYYVIVETQQGKQKVIAHLGSIDKMLKDHKRLRILDGKESILS